MSDPNDSEKKGNIRVEIVVKINLPRLIASVLSGLFPYNKFKYNLLQLEAVTPINYQYPATDSRA